MDAKSFTGEQLLAAVESGRAGARGRTHHRHSEEVGEAGLHRVLRRRVQGSDRPPGHAARQGEDAEVGHGQRACKDHSHPVVELTFKKSTDPTIQDLLLLLSKHRLVTNYNVVYYSYYQGRRIENLWGPCTGDQLQECLDNCDRVYGLQYGPCRAIPVT